MFEKLRGFIESKSPKKELAYTGEVAAIREAKYQEVWGLLERLTLLTDGLLGIEKAESEVVDFISFCNEIKAKTEDLESRAGNDNAQDPWIADEDLLIEVIKLMITPDYSPPLDNIVGMQVHLWTLSVYYLLTFECLPEAVDKRLDLARSRLAYAAGILEVSLIHKGKDRRRTRQSSLKQKNNKEKRQRAVMRFCSKMDLRGRSRWAIADIIQDTMKEWSTKTIFNDLKQLKIP